MKLICMECEKVFSRSNPTADTGCPRCHGYDIEPWAEDNPPEPDPDLVLDGVFESIPRWSELEEVNL